MKKRPSIGVSLSFQDFKTAEYLKSSSLSTVLGNGDFANFQNFTPGLAIHYFEGLTDHLDFMATFNGSYVNYPFNDRERFAGQRRLLTTLDANVNLKLLTDNYTIVPYLTGGVGVSMYSSSFFSAYTPLGAGLQIKVNDDAFIQTQAIFRQKTTDLATNHFFYTLGFSSALSAKKAPKLVSLPAPVVVPEKDTDGDGIVDSKDKCPSQKGTAKYDGCPVPDSDGDGINDEEDKCPSVKGLAKYKGCPIPDTDKDGINDEEDKCPTVAGLARYQGCPIPDTDKDGVNDEEDKCPKEAGVAANKGCPEIEKQVAELAKSVYFPTGSTTVGKEAAKTLDAVVEILNKYTDTKLTIEGHTDNVGRAASNKA
ncbi:MAG: OmpA family protein, partial [Chitinophagaceae bacterium]